MRHRAVCAVLAVLVGSWLSPAPAEGQVVVQQSGVKAGVTFASLAFDAQDSDAPAISRRAGFTAGLFAVRDLRPRLGLQVEALLSVKGAEFEADHLRITYLELPTLARYTFDADVLWSSPLHVVTGPALAFKLDAARSTGGESRSAGSEIRALDVGWIVGAGIDRDGFLVDLRYTWGLVDVVRVDAGAAKGRNTALSLMVGLRIPR